MRIFILSLVLSMLSLSATAAKLIGPDAANAIPFASEVIYLGNNSAPAFVRLSDGHAQPMYGAADWLVKNFKLDDRITFREFSREKDRYGMEHVRYRQYVDGHPVRGGQYIFHGRDGKWTNANGKLFLPGSYDGPALIGAEEAVGLALDYLPAEIYDWETAHPVADYPTAKLTWIAPDLKFEKFEMRLAYAVDVYAARPLAREIIYIDVVTGQRIASENRIQTNGVPGQAVTRFSGTRDIETSTDGEGLFTLIDTSRGASIETYNCLRQPDHPYVLFADVDNFWDNANAELDEVAGDAYWGSQMFYDYLIEQGRNSIDGQGEALEAHVHFDVDYANAFWDGTRTTYGDGSPGSVIGQPLTTLEIVAHEFGHGLTNRTADLIYAGESGGQNEGFSDIIGTYLDFRHNPATADWRIGAELDPDGQGFRDMEDPRIFNDPRNYQGDNWDDFGGVHTNSGVARHWFYTTINGGPYTNDFGEEYLFRPMHIDTVMEIEYNALVFYMTESSTYAEGGLATSIAAANLYGTCSDYPARVSAVWAALNVDFIPAGGVFANFTVEGPGIICELGEPTQFINLSVGDTYEWDFGDGTTSTENSPTHTYTAEGSYTIILTATGCEGQTETASRTFRVDPNAIACTAIVLPTQGEVSVDDCEGVLFDSGGLNEPHGNNEEAVLTISNEGDAPITLHFVEFNLESNYDFLTIFDGPTVNSPQLARLDGPVIPEDITSSGGAITLLFTSDGSVVRDGFYIEWRTGSGNAEPDASVSVSEPDVLLGAPVVFTPLADDGALSYDFGDGETDLVRGPATHRYQSSGTFTVTVIDDGCSASDTTTTTITVAEGSQYTITPPSICDTLPIGATASHTVLVTNVGDNPGTIGAGQLGDLDRSETQVVPIEVDAQRSDMRFDVPVILPGLTIELEATGDVTRFGRSATLWLEGLELGTATGNDDVSTLRLTVDLDAATLGSFAADGELNFTVQNSDNTFGFAGGFHQLTVSYTLTEWATIVAPANPVLGAGEQTALTVNLASRDLAPGLYETTIDVYTSDVDQPTVAYPIKLLVTGSPQPLYSTDVIDFGIVYTNQLEERPLVVDNTGTDTFAVTSIVSNEPNFSATPTDFIVEPFDPVTVSVLLNAPAVPGSLDGELTFMTTAGPRVIRVLAEVLEPPVATGLPDSLCFTVESGDVLDTLLFLGNDGVDELRYTLAPAVELLANSTQEYFEFAGFTQHLLPGFVASELTVLEVIVQGDFTVPGAELLVFYGGDLPFNVPVTGKPFNVPDTLYVPVDPTLIPENGEWEVFIINPNSTRWSPDAANTHTVNIYRQADWLSTSVAGGTVLAGEAFDHPLRADATDLFAGTYRTFLNWNSNDPLAEQLSIPVKLIVTGAPQLAVTVDSLDFGEVFLGYDRTLPLWIYNRGTADLEVENLSTDNVRYIVDTTDFVIAPMDSLSVNVTFTPDNLDRQEADLRVATPDDFLAVGMTGIGVATPIPAFSPDTVCVRLEAGQQETATLTVANSGEGRLDYAVPLSGGLASILVWTPASDPAAADYLVQVAGSVSGANITSSNTQDAQELSDQLGGASILLMPEMMTFFDNSDLLGEVIRTFVEGGGNLITVAQTNNDFLSNQGLLPFSGVFELASGDPLTYLQPEHPLLAGVDLPGLEERPGTRLGIGGFDPTQFDIVVGTEFSSETYVLAINTMGDGSTTFLGWNFAIENDNWAQVLRNAITQAPGSFSLPDWLSIPEPSGSVVAGGSGTLDFDFDATGLSGGEYLQTVPFIVNTPEDTRRTVVAKLIVLGPPVAGFTASTEISCDGRVRFTDASTIEPTSWAWDFGDGNSSTEANPQHTYTSSGSFTVSLTVCNEYGCDTYVLPTAIVVNLEDDFCLGVDFENNSDQVLSGCGGRIFDEGGENGSYSNNVNSSIQLNSSSGEQIRLEVQSFILEFCCDYLTIYDGPDDTSPLIGRFNGNDLQPGDEFISSGSQLYLTFTTDFSVTRDGFELTWQCVSDNGGVSIEMNDAQDDCPATFEMQPSRIDDDMSYHWDFGDNHTVTGAGPHTHTYAATGDYLVRLTMERDGETFRTQQTVSVDAVAYDVDINLPDGELVTETPYTFTFSSDADLSEYSWRLSDGTTGEGATFENTFDEAGTYTLYLLARGSDPCAGAAVATFFVDLIDNIEEQAAEIGLRMFPNPTVGDLTLETGTATNYGSSYEIHDVLGRLVAKGLVTDRQTTVATARLDGGAYILRVFDQQGQLLGGGRFIKQ